MTRTVAVDFDGVIHCYRRGWADGSIYDEPMPGAVEGLRMLMETYAVFVFTTREPEQVMPWLESHGLNVTIDERCASCYGEGGGQELDADWRPLRPAWECDSCKGSGELTFWNETGQLLVTNRKLPAIAYVDDRAVRFRSWDQALADLACFEGGERPELDVATIDRLFPDTEETPPNKYALIRTVVDRLAADGYMLHKQGGALARSRVKPGGEIVEEHVARLGEFTGDELAEADSAWRGGP
jgi:hypothetical protein